jgi:hypothetical protein
MIAPSIASTAPPGHHAELNARPRGRMTRIVSVSARRASGAKTSHKDGDDDIKRVVSVWQRLGVADDEARRDARVRCPHLRDLDQPLSRIDAADDGARASGTQRGVGGAAGDVEEGVVGRRRGERDHLARNRIETLGDRLVAPDAPVDRRRRPAHPLIPPS